MGLILKNRQKLKDRSTGFTIVEVMIVLAIAAFLILMIFLVVPQVQGRARDYQRKQYASQVATALADYAAIHGSSLPACSPAFVSHCVSAPSDANDFMIKYMPSASIDDYTSTSTAMVDTSFCRGQANPSQSVVYCWYDKPDFYIQHNLKPKVGQIFIAAMHLCGDGTGTPGPSGIPAYGDLNIKDDSSGTNILSAAAIMIGLESGDFLCIDG